MERYHSGSTIDILSSGCAIYRNAIETVAHGTDPLRASPAQRCLLDSSAAVPYAATLLPLFPLIGAVESIHDPIERQIDLPLKFLHGRS